MIITKTVQMSNRKTLKKVFLYIIILHSSFYHQKSVSVISLETAVQTVEYLKCATRRRQADQECWSLHEWRRPSSLWNQKSFHLHMSQKTQRTSPSIRWTEQIFILNGGLCAVLDLSRSLPGLSTGTSNVLLLELPYRISSQKYCGAPAPKHKYYRYPTWLPALFEPKSSTDYVFTEANFFQSLQSQGQSIPVHITAIFPAQNSLSSYIPRLTGIQMEWTTNCASFNWT